MKSINNRLAANIFVGFMAVYFIWFGIANLQTSLNVSINLGLFTMLIPVFLTDGIKTFFGTTLAFFLIGVVFFEAKDYKRQTENKIALAAA